MLKFNWNNKKFKTYLKTKTYKLFFAKLIKTKN